MQQWIETELKLLLPDEESFRRVQRALDPGPAATQVNHFFDREDGALGQGRIGVRLRSEGDQRLLTVKGAAFGDPDGALSQRIELERSIPPDAFAEALSEGLDLLPYLARFGSRSRASPGPAALDRFIATLETLCRGHRLRRYAGFTNRRETCLVTLRDERGAFEIELLLDETRLPGHRTDFEIEVELGPGDEPPNRVEGALRAWLEGRGVTQLVPASSKLARLQEQLTQRGGAPPR
jgi:uncharacterized protein YjbK